MPAYDPRDPDLVAFWTERHLATLSTVRRDGTPHVVPVGVTYDPDAGLAWIITSGASVKARNIERANGTAPVAVCQVDRARWSTLEGVGRISHDPDDVAQAVRRYAERYRQPRENPERVAILIEVTGALGSTNLLPR